ncbi:MAG: hybrid sensor histidine kinase/response regulator [Candidatus Kariarchaeaceae archaeon]|jgi:PAS domain S-box-containing protein
MDPEKEPQTSSSTNQKSSKSHSEEQIKYVDRGEHNHTNLFNYMMNGFSYHKIITDDAGVPIDYIFLDINPAFTQQTGLTREQVIGKKVTEAIPIVEDAPNNWIDRYGEVALSGVPIQFEGYAQGLKKHFIVNVYSDKKGYFSTIFTDITRIKNFEEKLQVSESNYRLIMEQASDGIFIADKTGKYLEVNKSGLEMLGYSLDEILEMNVEDTMDPEDLKTTPLKLNELLSGKTLVFERKMVRKDGSVVHTEISAKMVDDGRLLATIRDITDRKKAEKELEESEEKFRLLFEHSFDPIFWVNAELETIINCNKVATQLLERTKDEIIGQHHSFIHPPHIQERAKRVFREQVSTTADYTNETQLYSKSKKSIHVHLTSATISIGSQLIVQDIYRDITQSKIDEAERLKSQKIESLSKLTGGIVHDYNNILVGILGNVNILQYKPSLDEDVKLILKDIETAAIRAHDLTKQLLTFSKGGSPIKTPAHINDVIQDSVSLIMRGSKSQYELKFEGEMPVVEIDIGQISQMINNLIINAKQAMPTGGLLKISARTIIISDSSTIPLANGDYVQISIQDEGKGIPVEIQGHIFDPYFTTKPAGAGLGLATSFSIAKQHDGLLMFETEENKGTTFYIFLPVSDKQVIPTQSITKRKNNFDGRVLIMDDDPIVQKTLTKILVSQGFSVDSAHNGQECIDLYRKSIENGSKYEFLVMDLVIPGGMGGKETIAILRDINPDIVAIVSSGYSTDPILANYQDYGFTAVLNKPYTISEVIDTINSIL